MISWVKVYFLILFIIFPIFFFNHALFSYFSQDDFFHLRQVMDKNIYSLSVMLVPGASSEQTFYRPLGREFYNFVMINLFGVQPLPYHLVNLSLIIANGFLMYNFIKSFSLNKAVSVIALVVYITSAVHSVELYYLSSIQTILSTTFILLGITSYYFFLKVYQLKYWFFSIFCFLLAILSHESGLVFTGLLASLHLFFKSINLKKMFVYLSPFALLSLIRIFISFSLAALPNQQVYQPVFSIMSITNSIVWFTLWSFGLPEMLKDFITLRFTVNPNLFKWYGSYLNVLIPTFITMISVLMYAFIKFRKKFIVERHTLFYLTAFIISISPFIFFPNHKFVYYLTLPLIWFSALMSVLLYSLWSGKKLAKFLVVIFLGSYILLSYHTISLNKITHWSAKRSRAAQFLISDIKAKYPQVAHNTIFYLKKDPDYPQISPEWGSSSKQAFYILSGSDALQLNYRDTSLKVMYEDIDALPKEQDKVITYTAKFPY